ncbi:MAG: hypothetical protein M3Z21_01460 [Pseudomonadota bacterium]|nr:hypothetical protein [Pseudomonadota bacterium]
MPESSVGESRARRERLDPLAVALEGFTLDPDRLDPLADPGVAQRLKHGGRRTSLFLDAFRSGFGVCQPAGRLDPPPTRRLWNCEMDPGIWTGV